jgi:NADH pyrophosphatase NudC (nudix superfamily)
MPVVAPSEPDEVLEAKWFTPQELGNLKLDLDPDVAKIIL